MQIFSIFRIIGKR